VAKNGCYELLELITGVAKYLEHNPDGADVTVLTRKDTSATPIEEAINANQSQCLRILLEFARDTYIFDIIYNDKCLMPRAVIANSRDCLKVFLEVGMWIGTKEALLVAVRNKDRNHLIRMLLFYYTQVALVSNDTRVKHNGAVTITAGTLHWNDLDLVELDPDWLEDAIVALSIVSHSLKVKKVAHPILENKKLFETLGYSCNDYFTGFVWQPRSHPLMFVPLLISEIDLSNNKLENIPPELFQVSSLVTLNLSKNKLTALPSNLDFQKPLYTCSKLIKLDLSSNYLQTLPEDLFFIMGNNIEELNAQNNRIDSLPPALWICTRLHTLLLGQNRLSKLHYYSDVKYFYSQSYSHDLINSLQVDKGSIKISESTSEEDFMHIMNYATRLGIFHQTVASLMPSLTERQEDIMAATGSLSFVQHAIDIHWLRAKLDQTKPLDYFDIILPQDEDLVLSHLDLSQNQFTEFPWDLPCIAPNLEKLDLRGNMISEIHLVCDMPVNIASIILGDNKLTRVVRKLPVYPCGNPINLATGYITNPEVQGSCKHRIHRMLDRVTNMILNDNKITYFPCVPPEAFNQPLNDLESYEKYKQKAYFPNLSVLSLDRNCLESVPNGIHYLTQLSSLSLSHNTSITQLPIEMGLMNPQVLLVLKLDGIFPKNIEPKVLNKPGTRAVLSYLKSLYHKSQPYYRMKLMFVGNSNVGKTTLLMNLSRKGKITRFKEVEKGLNKQPLSTVGVDLGDWELPRRPKITFMTWDFGGQEEYYATHQCFLTQRSLCILVWDGRDGIKGLKSIKVWLENIRVSFIIKTVLLAYHVASFEQLIDGGDIYMLYRVEYQGHQ
jgi:Leucine-rich repeat (LRR) protein